MVRKLDDGKREKLLSSALRLFAANGPQSTSTAAIAQEAGTAAGTLFLYFPTKQELTDELALKISREQADFIKALLKPGLSARDMFRVIWNGSLQWFQQNRDAYRFVQQLRYSRLISETIIQETQKHLGYYFQAIQKGLEEQSIQPYALELIGEMLYQQIVAAMNLVDAQTDPALREQYTTQGFDIFWNGIKKEEE